MTILKCSLSKQSHVITPTTSIFLPPMLTCLPKFVSALRLAKVHSKYKLIELHYVYTAFYWTEKNNTIL